jgi:hypothetical protein
MYLFWYLSVKDSVTESLTRVPLAQDGSSNGVQAESFQYHPAYVAKYPVCLQVFVGNGAVAEYFERF